MTSTLPEEMTVNQQPGLSGLPTAFGGRAMRRGAAPRSKVKDSASYLGVGDVLGTGDSYLVGGILPNELADVAFEKMKAEVKWDTMHHRGEVNIFTMGSS
jgi:hypothetical protein